ncbi:MAG: porin family protein [Muribaculaceae bacterium]|nr:porin family protein [Muribaculaceae bacterium]
MNKFLKYIVLAVLPIFAALQSSAQFRYGPMVGVTLNTFKFKQDLVSVKQQPGEMAGLQAELMFPGIGIGIDLGLLYNQQGAQVNFGEKKVWSSLGYGNEHLYIHNINIPVHLRFKYTRLDGLEDIIAPLVYGGPEFNLQVGHSNCSMLKCSGGDLGLTAAVGAELFHHWQVVGAYTWGMTYVGKTRLLDDFSARSRQWSIRVSYLF